jgi:hypothetical protein
MNIKKNSLMRKLRKRMKAVAVKETMRVEVKVEVTLMLMLNLLAQKAPHLSLLPKRRKAKRLEAAVEVVVRALKGKILRKENSLRNFETV